MVRNEVTPVARDPEVTDWPSRWRGRWIWDHEPVEPGPVFRVAKDGVSHFLYLRRTFEVDTPPASVPARVTCDSRYVLFLNGRQLGRGPVRGEPTLLGWDEYDLAQDLRSGPNVVVALCRYYGSAGPWWLPASPVGTLGRGSFCFETSSSSGFSIDSDTRWQAVPAPWVPREGLSRYDYPSEVVDGRAGPAGLHNPGFSDDSWPRAVILGGKGQGTVLDRPPAAPYCNPARRPIPQLTSLLGRPKGLVAGDRPVRVNDSEDPSTSWRTLRLDDAGERRLSVWDMGRVTRGHVRLLINSGEACAEGSTVDVVAGEDLGIDGLPEIAPRAWAARYIVGRGRDHEITFFDPIGLRYLGVHHPPGIETTVEVEETIYPCASGAEFDCDDPRYVAQWTIGARTVALCSADAFLDCPGREQRAWIADAYTETLVTLVTNPDWRLIRHHLALTAASPRQDGLLAGAAACDFARAGVTMPEYSLHWMRSLAAYWLHSGDENFVRRMLPVADKIIECYERLRGSSGLLEDFPGWVFLDWAQVDRNVVIGAHDALYAAALAGYASLPGAAEVCNLIERTAGAFELLWDSERKVYLDAIGANGVSRRMSQHTNAAALLAGIVPNGRVAAIIERISDPAASLGGRLVVTPTSADMRDRGAIGVFQYWDPSGFDPERDVVAAQPWFCRFLHEAFFRYDRRDLILDSLLRWEIDAERGTFQEFWDAAPGTSSRCHGWSASPTYDLTSYILGVRPAEPGYGRALLDPYLGPLTRAEGRVPTPHGWLSVSLSRDPSEVQVMVPEGMVVQFQGADLQAGPHRITV